MKIGILEPNNFSPCAVQELERIGAVSFFHKEKIEDFVSDKDILFCRLKHFLGKEFLENAHNLKVICSPTTGLNHIDLEWCKTNNIEIISLKGETEFLNQIVATPEHTLGLILALYRNYGKAFLSTNNTDWNREKYRGTEIKKSKIGFVGFGRVANITAKYLTAMDAEIGYYDTAKISSPFDNAHIFPDINSLMHWADCIVLTASYIPEIGEIINREHFERMKGKYFINTARAELTNEEALLEFLSKGNHFKGVAVDVVQNEQLIHNNIEKFIALTDSNNLIITPHIGGATFDSMQKTEEFITHKLLHYNEKASK
jgi:D-3-phosphoglycerate dehydrogenase